MIAVERLLSISGEDTLTIDRKYRDPWTGRLPTRFMILTNELPRFTDSSGALASRFVISILTTSFYGRENPKLTDELLAEAPAIFNWALEGLDRLRDRGHFVTPTSARRGAPPPRGPRLAGRRVRARRAASSTRPSRSPRTRSGRPGRTGAPTRGTSRPGTKAVFARDLHAAVPVLASIRPRDGEARSHAWRGVMLRQQSEEPLTTPDQNDSAKAGQR